MAAAKTYFKVYFSLLALTALTVGAAFIDLGRFNFPLAFLIATCKALIVILFFMHVLHAPGLNKLFIGAGFLWLLILIGITLCDYQTRHWPEIPNKKTWIPLSASQFIPKS